MKRFLGGSPLVVLARLAAISIVVGIVMGALKISPENLLRQIKLLIRSVYDLGFGSIEWLLQYLMLGALVVVPVWLIARIVALGRRRGDDQG